MTSASLAAHGRRSPFRGLDIIEAAGWTSTTGAFRVIFDQDVWDLRGVEGRSRRIPDGELIWDFTLIANQHWRLVAKELITALLIPAHPAVAHLPHASRTQAALNTCYARLGLVTEWLNWLTGDGVTELGQVTQYHCDRYLAHRGDIYDKNGNRLREASPSYKRTIVASVIDLAIYGELFTSDRYDPALLPWKGKAASTVVGYAPTGENTTPVVPPETLQPFLAASLYLVEVMGPHIADLWRRLKRQPRRNKDDGAFGPSPTAELMAEMLRRHQVSREPLVETPPWQVVHRLNTGWDPGDPLLKVSFQALAAEAGCSEFRLELLDVRLRMLAEEAAADVGVAKPWGRRAPLVARADDQCLVPWTEPLHHREATAMVLLARKACLAVVAGLSGMRACELAELLPGCRRTTELAPGLVRLRLAGKLIKGQPLGGVHDEWVVIEQVHTAIALAEQLHPDPDGSLFGKAVFSGYYTDTFQPWINGPGGRRLGLARIPAGYVSLRMLRHTLAVELAYRPHGLLAAKVHLRHVNIATTEGYAARPGGSQAKLIAEIHEHERERNQALLLAELRNYQQGILPSGPGARDLITFFEHIDPHLPHASVPQLKTSDQEIQNLIAKRACTLHLANANYCWFIDPARALCLKLAGTPNADKPLAGMCDSARCPQATHHPCHRPVWQDIVTTTTIFIGSLSRCQRTERTRLQAELDRARRVLDEIDAAAQPQEDTHATH
jgi:hypothetical protein